MAFDHDQAEVIRKINKMGSIYGDISQTSQSPLGYLSSSATSPAAYKRRTMADKMSGSHAGFSRDIDSQSLLFNRPVKSPTSAVRGSADQAGRFRDFGGPPNRLSGNSNNSSINHSPHEVSIEISANHSPMSSSPTDDGHGLQKGK
jgi:hypothetical protein